MGITLKHEELIKKLTLDEKVSLLSGKNFWETKEISKYDIPSIFLSDGPNGLRKQAKAADQLGLNPSIPSTCFPTSACSANSWDPALLEKEGKALGEEAAANEVSILLGPGVNMKRNPRCGRNFEYFSEDPLLAGRLAAGFIRGVQSNGVISCVKHYACNNQEIRRITSDSVLDERTLREIYLPAFEIAVKEGHVGAVMSAYNKVNGVYCNENQHLLVDILRKEWDFSGLVITDWGGNNDRLEGLKATNELEMPTTNGETNREIKQAVTDGKISEEVLDSAVDRLIDATLKTSAALKAAPRTYDKEAHHKIAQEVAEGSIVLLKNKDHVLPLAPKTKIALFGDFAKNPRYQGAGSSIVNPIKVDTVLESIKDYDLAFVGYSEGFKRYGKSSDDLIGKAVALADKADVLVVFAGLDEVTEAEGFDRANIRLPDNQRELISALYHTGKKIVVVMNCGAVVEMPFIDRVDAIVHAYLAGEAGAKAVLNVLTGRVNPSGKLAETYPYGYPDIPSADHFGRNDKTIEYREGLYIGYRYFLTAGIGVRFPFGYGLSYTQFQYSALRVSASGVTFDLTNAGKVAGAEIAQLYIGLKNAKVFRPLRELKGFQKVFLAPGETKNVTIPFDEYSFRYFNVKTNHWEVEGGDYDLDVSSSSADVRLSGTIHQEGSGAPLPYDPVLLPDYYSGKVREIPDEEFEALLGHAIPLSDLVFIKTHRIAVDYNSSVADLRYAKGWTGRFFAGGMRTIIKALRATGHRSEANTLVMGVYYNPMRSLSRMTGGAISWKQLDGLILMFNGHFHKGLHHYLKAGREKKRLAKAEAKGLKAENEKGKGGNVYG
jgi:beta-glucosidase